MSTDRSSIRIRPYGDWATEHEATSEVLIAAGLAIAEMFEGLGKSGTRTTLHTRSLPLEERHCVRRMGGGLWRLTRAHEPGKPPVIPGGFDVVPPRASRAPAAHAPASNIIPFPRRKDQDAPSPGSSRSGRTQRGATAA